MPAEELIDAEAHLEVAAVADRLRELAEQLEAGVELTVDLAGESVTVPAPQGTVEYEVELEREPDEYELEIELEWPTEAPTLDDEASLEE